MSGEAGDNSALAAIVARVEPEKFDADDHAILDRLLATTREVDRCFTEFEFSAAVQALYAFFWNDFCDWYVEVSKSKLQGAGTKANCLAIQDLVLRQTLLLLHPFIPFITEELWGQLGYGAPGAFIQNARLDPTKFDADDHAILDRLLSTTRELNRAFYEFEFSAATQALYAFFWGDFCDWYVEVSKSKLQDPDTKANCLALQDLVLRQTLLLLHPFIPFITEELWHQLGFGADGKFIEEARLENASQIVMSSQARGFALDRAAVAAVERLKVFVSQARALKAEHNLASRRDVKLFVTASDADWSILEANLAKLVRMSGAAEITRRDKVEAAPAIVTPLGTVYLDLASTVDVGAEKARLTKELEQLAKHIAGTEARLANQAFVSKAPPAVLEGARKQLADQQAKRAELERLLKGLG
jgi:valyl-tRNA synthetase